MFRRARGALTVLLGLLLLATAAIASAAGAQAATSPNGSIGVQLLGTSNVGSDPHSRLYIVNRLAPGAQVTRRIELSNTSPDPITISVYASAADVTKDAFTWADGKTANELTSWTSLNQTTVTIPGGGRQVETVSIKVPTRVSTGERYGVIWAQVASTPGSNGGVRLVNRVGVRMYVSVGSGNLGAANFTLSQLAGHRDAKGIPSVTATVHNTGGRALDLTGTLSLSKGPGGLTGGPFTITDSATIAAGETRKITVLLDRELPDGPWAAQLSLQAAAVSKKIGGQVEFVKANSPANAAKIVLLVGGPIVLITIIVFGDQYRRRRKYPAARPRESYRSSTSSVR